MSNSLDIHFVEVTPLDVCQRWTLGFEESEELFEAAADDPKNALLAAF